MRPGLAAPLRSLAAAGTFLTRLPIPARAGCTSVVAGAGAFGVVGAGIGALVGGTTALLYHIEPAAIAAAVAVALELLLTGALHLDGLADSADGLGAHGRERALAAMRDHALGAYGVCAIALDLLLKTAALAALAPDALAATVAALSLSRAAALPLARTLPYARTGAGTGRELSEELGWSAVLAAVLSACAIALAVLGIQALALIGAAALVTLAVGLICKRRLAGVTGDTLGAAIELAGTTCLIVAAGLAR